jgi:hypothetical protein
VNAVLYGIGLSTDPYVDDRPRGIGVAWGLDSDELERTELHDRSLLWFGQPRWIDGSTVVATRRGPPYRPPVLFGVRRSGLERLGPAPLGRLEPDGRWSPDGTLVASEPIARCGDDCYRSGGSVYVTTADGSSRSRVTSGHVAGWTPDGRLLVTDDYVRYVALDLETGEREEILPRSAFVDFAGVPGGLAQRPIWSADGRYIAAYGSPRLPEDVARQTAGAFVVARADGTIVRLVTTPYIVSMLAWSPTGHRLAYTTSGFPDPHELWVVDDPAPRPVANASRPRKLFATGDRHFDWVT